MQVEIINKSPYPIPQYQTAGAAGVDLYAHISQDITIQSMERLLIPTGIFIAIPLGYEAQIRPRSGLALKKGLTCLNSPGTIDADYRGEIKVLLINLSCEKQTIIPGERIAQMIFSKHETVVWKLVNTLSHTERNEGGFGSTDIT